MPKPETLKKADPESYVLCKKCSAEVGEEVFYHKKRLKERRAFLSNDTKFECPFEHELKVEGDDE